MSVKPRKPQEPPISVRLPPALKAEIDDAANGNDRSLHAEIVGRLEASLKDDGPDPEVKSLKIISAALADQLAWIGEPDEARLRALMLQLFKVGINTILDNFGATVPTEEITLMGAAAARRVITTVRTGAPDTVMRPEDAKRLAEVGRAWGLDKKEVDND